MSTQIKSRHLLIEVKKEEMTVCGEEGLRVILQKKLGDHGLLKDFYINDRESSQLAVECAIRTNECGYRKDVGNVLKMAVIRILEDEGFKVVSMMFNQLRGSEIIMMYKEH